MATTSGTVQVPLKLGSSLMEVVEAELGNTRNKDVAVVVEAIEGSCRKIAALLAKCTIVGMSGEQGGAMNVQVCALRGEPCTPPNILANGPKSAPSTAPSAPSTEGKSG